MYSRRENPFRQRILSILHGNHTNLANPSEANSIQGRSSCSQSEASILAAVHTHLRKCKKQAEQTSKDDYIFLAENAVKLGYESIARLLVEYGKVDVSVLYSPELWRTGRSRLNKASGERPSYKESIEHANTKRYDRYGFLYKQKTKSVLRWNDFMDRKQTSRDKKWHRMLKAKEPLKKGLMHRMSRKKWRKRVRKGMPYNVRAQAWRKMIPIEKLKKPGVYQSLLQKEPNSSYTKVIDCDVLRQSRDHRFFEEKYSPDMLSLFNVLKAYSVYDPEIGYCQGMCPIAAAMYIVLQDEEEAFWAFYWIMQSPHTCMRDIFQTDFSLLKECYWCHNKMLDSDLPKLKRHFDHQNVLGEYYATKNYMTCFIDHLEFDIALLILDNVILDGRRVLFSFSLDILKQLTSELDGQPFEVILPKLQHLDEQEINVHRLMAHKRLDNNKYQEWRNLYRKQLKKKQ